MTPEQARRAGVMGAHLTTVIIAQILRDLTA